MPKTFLILASIVVATLSSSAATAVDLAPTLPCALVSTTKGAEAGDRQYCLKVFNTCNAPITTTARDAQTGEELQTPPIPRGERDEVCGSHALALVGHAVGGP